MARNRLCWLAAAITMAQGRRKSRSTVPTGRQWPKPLGPEQTPSCGPVRAWDATRAFSRPRGGRFYAVVRECWIGQVGEELRTRRTIVATRTSALTLYRDKLAAALAARSPDRICSWRPITAAPILGAVGDSDDHFSLPHRALSESKERSAGVWMIDRVDLEPYRGDAGQYASRPIDCRRSRRFETRDVSERKASKRRGTYQEG
jgi:hypothetical protein